MLHDSCAKFKLRKTGKGEVEMKAGRVKKIVAIFAGCLLAGCNGSTEVSSSPVSQASSIATTSETVQTNETGSVAEDVSSSSIETITTVANVASGGAIDASGLFTDRDLRQSFDLGDAEAIIVSDGQDVTIREEGIYVVSGSASDTTLIVEADDGKVQLVLDGVSIANADYPCIYVKSADKVFITTTDSDNALTVSGEFVDDGEASTDGVIFSKDDIVLNGVGRLAVSSSDNGIVGKDDLKITGGTYVLDVEDCAIEANDSIAICDGTFTITAQSDGLHSDGYVYICGGDLGIRVGDDGIHAENICQIDDGNIVIEAAEGIEATWVQINGGAIRITASDDGVNAAQKASDYTATFEMNDGYLTVSMGVGDTDAIDSNGNIYVNGGTIDITSQNSFDYDGLAQYNGGTIIVNGEETNTITNQMMGGGMPGGPGWMGGRP